MFSPWQWFCSTRTFSNCLETSMTITALYFWPWEMTTASVATKPPKLRALKSAKGKAIAPVPAKHPLPSIFEAPKAVTKYDTTHLLPALLKPLGSAYHSSLL